MYLRRADGEKIYIDESVPLGQGGEARVYAVSEFPSWAAKVYLDERATPERAAKLDVMRNHPPRVPIGSDDHVPIAWPVELLYDLKNRERVVGFLMPRAYDVVEIIDFYNAQHRLQFNPLFDYRYLLRAARNLAATVRALHARNYIVGDLKHANILATNTALITLVDTDSFQVVDPDTQQIYPCPVRTPEFTPPELQGIATGQEILLPEHDNFGLAVLIFHLLMEGTHPFAGVYEGEDDPPPFEDRIAQGHFPYGANPGPYRPASAADSRTIFAVLRRGICRPDRSSDGAGMAKCAGRSETRFDALRRKSKPLLQQPPERLPLVRTESQAAARRRPVSL